MIQKHNSISKRIGVLTLIPSYIIQKVSQQNNKYIMIGLRKIYPCVFYHSSCIIKHKYKDLSFSFAQYVWSLTIQISFIPLEMPYQMLYAIVEQK